MESVPEAVVRPYSTWPVATSLTVQMIVALVCVMLVAETDTMLGPEVVGVGVGVGAGAGVAVGVGAGVGVATGVGLGTGVLLPTSTETTASMVAPATNAPSPFPLLPVECAEI